MSSIVPKTTLRNSTTAKETIMNRIWRTFVIAVLCAACCEAARAQVAPPTILEIDIENFVAYYDDVPDVSKRATDPNATTAVLGRNFAPSVLIADIVAVNGQPAKGTFVYHALTLNLRAAPINGQGIADIVRNNINNQAFEISKSDGIPIGTIMTSGLGVGSAPPGAPLAVTQGNNAIVGGTGAFLGARGQVGLAVQTASARLASMTEDPANRRRYGGGKARFALHVIPMSRPEIIVNSSGPAVVHANDFTQVTGAKPATSGELLILYATGLGPTQPGVDPGKPFTASPQQIVNSPVEVTANGRSAEVLYAGGFPGSVDGYHVSFRLPSGTTAGEVSLHLTSAFIPGTDVKIAVR
jgi:uncharacterized protein (TIGR03437 family)